MSKAYPWRDVKRQGLQPQVTSGRRGQWMGTYTGGRFYPLDPRPSEVDVRDIAHHLALQCRYNGATKRHYSIAEHSVIVSQYVPPEFALEALMHDAAEAYVGDMIRPLKSQIEMHPFRVVETRVYMSIMEAIGVRTSAESATAIAEVDERITVDEIMALMRRPERYLEAHHDVRPLGCRIAALEPRAAEYVFLTQYRDLTGVDYLEDW